MDFSLLDIVTPLFLIGISWKPKESPLDLNGVLKNYYDKQGGITSLKTIKSLTVDGHIMRPDLSSCAFQLIKKNPHKSCVIMNVDQPGQEVTMAFNGSQLWQKLPGMKPSPVDSATEELFLRDVHMFSHLINPQERGASLKLIDTIYSEERHFYRIQASIANKEPIIYYIDAESFLEAKIEYSTRVDNVVVKHEVHPSQYLSVGKLIQPFIIRDFTDGQLISITQIDKMQINTPVADALFEPHD